MTLVIEDLGGVVPVQANGNIDGHEFYFRARHGEWSLEVADPEAPLLATGIPDLCKAFYEGDDPFKGYMPPWLAMHILYECHTLFRAKIFRNTPRAEDQPLIQRMQDIGHPLRPSARIGRFTVLATFAGIEVNKQQTGVMIQSYLADDGWSQGVEVLDNDPQFRGLVFKAVHAMDRIRKPMQIFQHKP